MSADFRQCFVVILLLLHALQKVNVFITKALDISSDGNKHRQHDRVG